MNLQETLHINLRINFLYPPGHYVFGITRIGFTRRNGVSRKGIKKRKLSKNFQKKRSLSKNLKNKKISMNELPLTTIQVTIRALRWIFFLIFIYIAVSIVILILQGGNESIANISQIIVYSVSGFFTFFMGYFGWMFARNVLHLVSGKKPKEEF